MTTTAPLLVKKLWLVEQDVKGLYGRYLVRMVVVALDGEEALNHAVWVCRPQRYNLVVQNARLTCHVLGQAIESLGRGKVVVVEASEDHAQPASWSDADKKGPAKP